jgi:hypothetical protein
VIRFNFHTPFKNDMFMLALVQLSCWDTEATLFLLFSFLSLFYYRDQVWALTYVSNCQQNEIEVGEVQSSLNQKLGSKLLRAVDFASRFILLIKSKFKIHTFNSYYESRCKINDSQRFWTQFLFQRDLNLPASNEIDPKFFNPWKWSKLRTHKEVTCASFCIRRWIK